MKSVLDSIENPRDLKKLTLDELKALAGEVRRLIVEVTSKSGGHLASSLGAVDIAIAAHYAFDAPEDKILWDVGHQAYAHKIITGRKREFHTLRQSGGISGFPKPSESVFDAFGVGHSSTSISAALGMAVARDLKGGRNRVIAVIGDGSLTAGIAFEGLNQAGHLKKDLVVIVNDNEMSISQNVGALSSFLSKKITGRFATRLKAEVENFMKSIPMIGGRLVNIAKKAEDSLITLLTPGMIFEGLGFHYIGPIDGHDMEALVTTFNDIKGVTGPVLVHVLTKKGKGYRPAEEDPAKFHGVSPFHIDTGCEKKEPAPTYTGAFSSALVDIADTDPRIVAITAAMPEGTGLSVFAKKYPDRFFDVGIAEPHAVTFAAGLAKEGFIPVAAIYSTFLQRAYDQVFHDVCLQNLPVVIAMDRAGIVGQDGPTHHGLFDMSYLRHLPNIVLMAPADEAELRDMLFSGTRYARPVAIRYPRGVAIGLPSTGPMKEIPLGKADVLLEGGDVTVLAIGSAVQPALEAARRLAGQGIKACVVNCRFIKPLDEECIVKAASSTGYVVTVEEGALQGGFGGAVLELLEDRGVRCRVKRIGVPDEVVEHGTQGELRKKFGLDAEGIENSIKSFLAGKSSKIIRGNFL